MPAIADACHLSAAPAQIRLLSKHARQLEKLAHVPPRNLFLRLPDRSKNRKATKSYVDRTYRAGKGWLSKRLSRFGANFPYRTSRYVCKGLRPAQKCCCSSSLAAERAGQTGDGDSQETGRLGNLQEEAHRAEQRLQEELY